MDFCLCKTEIFFDKIMHLETEMIKDTLPASLFSCFDSWIYKIFDFHLFKFTKTKDKVARSDFISKCFTNLRQTKRKLRVKRIEDIFIVYKHTLGCFRTKI